MPRLRSGIVYDDWSGASGSTAEEYIEPERDTWTGLYDHNGDPLHREREPIGYQPDRWRTPMPNANQKKPSKKSKGKKGGC